MHDQPEMKTGPLLTLAISTLGAGVERIVLPAPRSGLEILVVWQMPDRALPAWALREDVRVLPMEERGLSRSRNLAIKEAHGQIAWLFDDDAVPDLDVAFALARRLQSQGSVALVGRFADMVGHPTRPVHKRSGQIGLLDAPSVASIEMLLDVGKVRALGVGFDTDFGLGARWTMGEEMIFVLDVLKRGGRVSSDPAVLARHPTETTGDSFGEERVWMASSAALRRGYGWRSGALRPIMAWRKRHVLGWKNAWRYLWVRP